MRDIVDQHRGAAEITDEAEFAQRSGDMIAVSRRDTVVEPGGRLLLRPETLEKARRLAPGADIYALEAEWQTFARRTPPRNPDKAFVGWVAKRQA